MPRVAVAMLLCQVNARARLASRCCSWSELMIPCPRTLAMSARVPWRSRTHRRVARLPLAPALSMAA
jgi:hypothetical protein